MLCTRHEGQALRHRKFCITTLLRYKSQDTKQLFVYRGSGDKTLKKQQRSCEFPTFVRWSKPCHWILFVLEHSDTTRQTRFQNDFISDFEAWRLQGKNSSFAARQNQHKTRENKLSHWTPTLQIVDQHSSCQPLSQTNNFLNTIEHFDRFLSKLIAKKIVSATSVRNHVPCLCWRVEISCSRRLYFNLHWDENCLR